MPQSLSSILLPKKSLLKKAFKPQVIIYSSPWDDKHGAEDSAVRYSGAKRFLEDLGYRVLNKSKIQFNTKAIAIKPIIGGNKEIGSKAVTIWLESHGAPGWLFGEKPLLDSELFNMGVFIQSIKQLAQKTGITIENVVLNCCNSATEYLDPDTTNYFNSPARLLSMFLPNVNVVGFVGHNASAKTTHIWTSVKGELKPATLSLIESSVLFQNGTVIESPPRPLYFEASEIPSHIRKLCGLNANMGIVLHTDPQARLEKLGMSSLDNSGTYQLKYARKVLKRLAANEANKDRNEESGELGVGMVQKPRTSAPSTAAAASATEEVFSENPDDDCSNLSARDKPVTQSTPTCPASSPASDYPSPGLPANDKPATTQSTSTCSSSSGLFVANPGGETPKLLAKDKPAVTPKVPSYPSVVGLFSEKTSAKNVSLLARKNPAVIKGGKAPLANSSANDSSSEMSVPLGACPN